MMMMMMVVMLITCVDDDGGVDEKKMTTRMAFGPGSDSKPEDLQSSRSRGLARSALPKCGLSD